MMNRYIQNLCMFAIVVCALCACAARTEPEATATKATPVHVIQPVPGPAAPPVMTTGILTSADELKLSFKTGGVVQRVLVREGGAVKAGQVLAELMPTEINAAFTQAQQLNDKAQRDLERGMRLYDDQVISLEQFQNLQTQAKVAAAQLDAARFNQNWVRVTAPGAGVILRKLVDDHEAVAPGQPVLVLGASQRGYIIKAGLSDRELVQLKVGDRVTVTLDALSNTNLAGHVSVLGGAAQVENGLFPVEVALVNLTSEQKDKLVAGMVAHVAMQPAAAKDTLLYIPTGAVVAGIDQQASIYVLQGEQAKKRDVQVAFFTRDRVALRNGLAANEQVITDGALYLSDGEHVSVLKE